MALSILNIDMDCYGSTTDRMATRGVGPCICFIIILNKGKEVFIEHRSDIFLPQEINLDNISLCFENLADHIAKVAPTSEITGLLIFGGNEKQQRFPNMQKYINELIHNGLDDDVSLYYQQLLSNVISIDVCFNTEVKLEGFTCQSSLDVIVDKGVNSEERTVIINQYIRTAGELNILIAVLSIEINSKKKSFTINQLEIDSHKNKSSHEYEFANTIGQHFQVHATALGAVKLEDDIGQQMLNYSRSLTNQIDVNFYNNQKELEDVDQEMCQCLHNKESNTSEDDDIDDV